MVPHNRNTNTFVVIGNIKRCPSKGQQYSWRRISFLVVPPTPFKVFYYLFNWGGGGEGGGGGAWGGGGGTEVCVCVGGGGIVVCFKAC